MVACAVTLVAGALTMMALAVWPPSYGTLTALLIPFSHLAVCSQANQVLAWVLGPLQWLVYAAFLGKGFVKGTIARPSVTILLVHALAAVVAVLVEFGGAK